MTKSDRDWLKGFLAGIFIAVLVAVVGCIDHDAQLVRYRVERCIERTFIDPWFCKTPDDEQDIGRQADG